MELAQTLWDILDHKRRQPEIVDSREPGTREHFASSGRPVRWKLGVSAATVLVAGILVLVVAAQFARSLAPEAEHLPVVATDTPVPEQRSEEIVVVHVVGAVNTPGVVSLPATSRVEDAVLLAGGVRDDAELAGVNLARVVFDGEQIIVPVIGEATATGEISSGGPISLSTSDQATLETLPRIGPATAQRIIQWREAHGPFRSVEDLLAVSGIGPATLDGVRSLVVP